MIADGSGRSARCSSHWPTPRTPSVSGSSATDEDRRRRAHRSGATRCPRCFGSTNCDAIRTRARVPGIPFGRLDLPAEQRQPLAVHDPAADGHLLVLGAARSGRTTALATFAADARCRIAARRSRRRLGGPRRARAAALRGSGRGSSGRRGDEGPLAASARTVLVIDDLDLLIDRIDPDARHEFVDLLARVARESRRVSLIVSAQRLTSPVCSASPDCSTPDCCCGNRVATSTCWRAETVRAFDPRLPPGAGRWHGRAAVAAPSSRWRSATAPLPTAELVAAAARSDRRRAAAGGRLPGDRASCSSGAAQAHRRCPARIIRLGEESRSRRGASSASRRGAARRWCCSVIRMPGRRSGRC